MRIQMTPKTVRRILSADGYLDLGMPERAIEELDRIEDAGPLEGPVQLLHGIALKQTQNHRIRFTCPRVIDGQHLKIKVPPALHRICCKGFCKAVRGFCSGIECLIVERRQERVQVRKVRLPVLRMF